MSETCQFKQWYALKMVVASYIRFFFVDSPYQSLHAELNHKKSGSKLIVVFDYNYDDIRVNNCAVLYCTPSTQIYSNI